MQRLHCAYSQILHVQAKEPWSTSLAGRTPPGRPLELSLALAEELHLLACHRAPCLYAGQGQGWLCWVWQKWFAVSFFCPDWAAIVALLAQSHVFYIPRNLCKDWFVISLKVCNTPLSRHLFSQLRSKIASTKTLNEILWAFLKTTKIRASTLGWLFLKYVAKWVWYDSHANNTSQCCSRCGDSRAWGMVCWDSPWVPLCKQSRISVSFPGFKTLSFAGVCQG